MLTLKQLARVTSHHDTFIDEIDRMFKAGDPLAQENRMQLITMYAEALLAKHTDPNWTFAFDKATRRIGCCKYRTKTVSLSRHYAQTLSWAQIDDTIRHEIAHILAGSSAGHGPEWKKWARYMGADDKACANLDADEIPESKYMWATVEGDGSIHVWKEMRGPNKRVKNIRNKYLKRRKAATLGKLALIATDDYKAGRISQSRLIR